MPANRKLSNFEPNELLGNVSYCNDSKQTTIGLFSARFDYEVITYLELYDCMFRGNVLFVWCLVCCNPLHANPWSTGAGCSKLG